MLRILFSIFTVDLSSFRKPLLFDGKVFYCDLKIDLRIIIEQVEKIFESKTVEDKGDVDNRRQ